MHCSLDFVQSLLSSSLLTKILKIKTYRIICLLFGMGVKLGHSQLGRRSKGCLLRRIFEPKREEVTGEWRKLYNEELIDLYFSPNIVEVINMRWAGHVARMGRGKAYTGLWWGNLMERVHLEDPGVDGRILLRWIFRKLDEGHRLY